MLLIFEIILTVTAWRRGWKAWALVPIPAGLSIAFLLGAVMAPPGGSMDGDEVMAVALLIDLGIIGALVAMVGSPRTAEQGAESVSSATELGERAADGISIKERAVEVMSAGGQRS